MEPKRELQFETIGDIVAELDRLQPGAITTHGTWSYYQILNHLSDALEWSMGADNTFFPDEVPDFKPELGRKFFDRMVRKGKMAPGIKNENSPQERVEGDEAAEFQRLRDVLQRVENHKGTWAFHPIFGELNADEWAIWCRLHCALHLGYVEAA